MLEILNNAKRDLLTEFFQEDQKTITISKEDFEKILALFFEDFEVELEAMSIIENGVACEMAYENGQQEGYSVAIIDMELQLEKLRREKFASMD